MTIENKIDIEEANQHLATLSASDRIKWASEQAPKRLVATTSGGKTSHILPHLIQQDLDDSIPTIFVDTGYYRTETYQFIDKMRKDGIDIIVYKVDVSPDEIKILHSMLLEGSGAKFDEAVSRVKHEPLNRAFKELNPAFWLRGIMSFQTPERSTKQVLEYENGLYRLYPLIDWNKEQAHQYLKENNLPINLNHYDITKGPDGKRECKMGDAASFTDGGGI